MRDLNLDERRALLALSELPRVEIGVIEMTSTQLRKSIIDATESVRDSFRRTGFHVYENQGLGPEARVQRSVSVGASGALCETSISLYRPIAKGGDPRLWISGLPQLMQNIRPNDLIGIVQDGSNCFVANLSHFDSSTFAAADRFFRSAPLGDGFQTPPPNGKLLLAEFRALAAAGPLPGIRSGPTSIGHAIETALGIRQNSSKDPDKYGIEIKASRHGGKNRVNLLAKVPDWGISTCTRSAEILDNFGYLDEHGRQALRCTVSSVRVNSQGLFFEVDLINSLIHERHRQDEVETAVASWKLETLRQRLAKKHNETFWVDATEIEINGSTYFKLNKITHTRSPNLIALGLMIADGSITMDHVMKRLESGATEEKGPLFKIWEKDLPRLFAIVGEYQLS